MARSKLQSIKDSQRRDVRQVRENERRYFIDNGFNKGHGKYNGIHRDTENIRPDTRSIEDAEWSSIQHIDRDETINAKYLAREAAFRNALNSPKVKAAIARALDWRNNNPEPWQVMQSAWLYVRKNYPDNMLAINLCKWAMLNATLVPPTSKVRR